jgi:hypothetical protein
MGHKRKANSRPPGVLFGWFEGVGNATARIVAKNPEKI